MDEKWDETGWQFIFRWKYTSIFSIWKNTWKIPNFYQNENFDEKINNNYSEAAKELHTKLSSL